MKSEVIHGDALDVLQSLARRPGWDPSRVVVLTDPPWPDCEHIEIDGADDPVGVWRRVAWVVPSVAKRLILWLGRNTDPREMLGAVPLSMDFATAVNLRMVPPGYRGPVMGGDLAYVFGKLRLPEGRRVLPGEIVSNGPQHARENGKLDHPCPRSPMHARGLVRWYCAKADVIVDPFCGSGTTLVAAAELDISYIGVDSDERWVLEARARIERAEAQRPLLTRVQATQGELEGVA